jgi:hypothetical protein
MLPLIEQLVGHTRGSAEHGAAVGAPGCLQTFTVAPLGVVKHPQALIWTKTMNGYTGRVQGVATVMFHAGVQQIKRLGFVSVALCSAKEARGDVHHPAYHVLVAGLAAIAHWCLLQGQLQ